MQQRSSSIHEPIDFSLVQGGPLFQLLLRARLIRQPTDLLGRRILVITLIVWLPLLVLTCISGSALGGTGVPFLMDTDAQVRCLLFTPLLIAGEVVVHQRIRVIVRQFLDRGLVAPADQPQFEQILNASIRLRNSISAETLLLAITYAGGFLVWEKHFALNVPTWFAHTSEGNMQFSAAGYWYYFVSLMVMRFLWVRWYFRIFIWYRFLWQISRRIPLRLNALHPDRAGGLGFLAESAFAFAPVLTAHTIALSGFIGGKILHEGASLPQFKLEILAWVLFLILLVFAPMLFFFPNLADARRSGLREYGIFAGRYVADFRNKWLSERDNGGDSGLGSSDIQSLADLSNSFEVAHSMLLVPFGRANLVRLAIVLILPLSPLLLTMVPLEMLIDRALGVFL